MDTKEPVFAFLKRHTFGVFGDGVPSYDCLLVSSVLAAQEDIGGWGSNGE
jgi:hypothetical protein